MNMARGLGRAAGRGLDVSAVALAFLTQTRVTGLSCRGRAVLTGTVIAGSVQLVTQLGLGHGSRVVTEVRHRAGAVEMNTLYPGQARKAPLEASELRTVMAAAECYFQYADGRFGTRVVGGVVRSCHGLPALPRRCIRADPVSERSGCWRRVQPPEVRGSIGTVAGGAHRDHLQGTPYIPPGGVSRLKRDDRVDLSF